MKKFTKNVLAILLSVIMAVCSVFVPVSAIGAQQDKANNSIYVEGEVIAVLKDAAPQVYLSSKKAAANYGRGIKLDNSVSFNGKKGKIRAVVLKSNDLSTAQMIKELKKNENIKYAFPNYKKKASAITNDTYSSYQWALDNKGQSEGTANLDTQADSLWETASASEKEQVVAIVDTGIDYNHEDLKDVLWENPYGSKLVGKYGYDFSDTIKDHTPLDDNGHGTHCAGIIAASSDNEKGISGINKSKVKIMACKFLDEEGSGTTEAALASYEYIGRALELGANIVAVNNSWCGYGDRAEQMLFDEVFDSFGEKGAISLIAAGNEGVDLSKISDDEDISYWFGDDALITPSCSSSKYCLTVAATNEKDELADFSNYSSDYVDVGAPGCNILSSVSYNCFNPSIYSADKKAAVVSDMQDYEGALNEGDFGYPNFFELFNEDSEYYEYKGNSKAFSVTEGGFNTSSKSLKLVFNDEVVEEDEGKYYAFAIPYTIADENKEYSISFMLKGTNDLVGMVSDVPADYDFVKNYDDAPVNSFITGGKTGNYWNHYYCDIKPSDKEYSKKLRSKNRKLVFVLVSSKAGTTVNIDDFAISAQVDFADFEKYDFYNGTSMATPYVSGAVALVKNAFPKATTEEVINIVKNTGRISASLDGKTENSKIISLENTDKAPAMIVSAKYNKDGNIEVKGSFKNSTNFKINGKAATPISKTESVAVFKENANNTKKNEIVAQNTYGSDSISVLLSNKPIPKKSKVVFGAPMVSPEFGYYMPGGAITIPAGMSSYFVSETGSLASIAYDDFEEGYSYNDFIPQIDFKVIFKEVKSAKIKSAVYYNGKIYFTAINEITSKYSDIILGADSAFGYIDMTSGKTYKLCEFPTASDLGDSLALYKGTVYLIGGYDTENNTFSKTVYKYNSTKKAFDKTSYPLPEGRAFTRFIQYGDKLIGMYGSIESGSLPKAIIFNGKSWKNSAFNIESDEYDEYSFENGSSIKVYDGSVGYVQNGICCNGVYIYGLGDIYYYNDSSDKFSASKSAFKNKIGEKRMLSTSLPGTLIAFETELGDEDAELGAYSFNINNGYASIDKSKLSKATVSSYYEDYYSYGDKVSITLAPQSGYVIKSISANGTVVSENSNKASFIMNASKVSITAKTLRVSPDKTKAVKVKTSSKSYTVSWKKPARAQGYQVQTYVGKKWKTVKTINSGNTLKFTIAKSKAGKKFRVRAFAKYNGKTYYGAFSDAVKA